MAQSSSPSNAEICFANDDDTKSEHISFTNDDHNDGNFVVSIKENDDNNHDDNVEQTTNGDNGDVITADTTYRAEPIAYEIEQNETTIDNNATADERVQTASFANNKIDADAHHRYIRLRGLPFSATEKDVREFLGGFVYFDLLISLYIFKISKLYNCILRKVLVVVRVANAIVN